MTERYDLMSENPHMKYSYELHSVLPLTYYWSPKSYKLRYFLLGNKVTLEQDFLTVTYYKNISPSSYGQNE